MKEIQDLKEFAAFARRMPAMQRMANAGRLVDDAIEKTVALVERLDARTSRLEGLLSRHQETIAAMIGDSNDLGRVVRAVEKTVALVERLDARTSRLEGLLSRHQETIAAMIGDSNASEAVRVRAIFEGGDYGG